MTKDELSLLLYLESRAVDQGGKVDSRKMNEDDFAIAKRWADGGYIQFGRVCAADCTELGGTNWVILSAKAWKDAHKERRDRAERMWEKRTFMTTDEKRNAS